MTTENMISHLKGIMAVHWRPLDITSEKGPSYRLTFEEFCKQEHINHQISTAYMPSHNGRAEVAVQTLKNMIICNQGENLKNMVAPINYRPSSLMGTSCTYTGKTGNIPRIGLPTIVPRISTEEKPVMSKK